MSNNYRSPDSISKKRGGNKVKSNKLGRPSKKKSTQENIQTSPSSSTEVAPPPPPNTGDNNTIVAQNPFDDCPPQQRNLAMLNKPPTMQTPLPPPSGTGKIYPPNQPMIFNPANPNAPPIYPCGVCHKEVHDNDQAILCESGCNFWFHRTCTGLTEPAYHLLTQEVYAEWVCDKCLTMKNIPLVKMKP